MAPTTKKQLTNNNKVDLAKKIHSVSPELPRSCPLEKQVKEILQKLRGTSTQTSNEAETALQYLRNLFSKSVTKKQKARKNVAKIIASMDGVPLILVALREWLDTSADFCDDAIFVLANILVFVPALKPLFVRIGGPRTLLAAGTKYKDYSNIAKNTIVMIGNLSFSRDDGKPFQDIVSDECIQFVKEGMELFPKDECLMNSGCAYFRNLAGVHGMKAKLRKQGIKIRPVLLEAVEAFSDKNSREYKNAMATLKLYL